MAGFDVESGKKGDTLDVERLCAADSLFDSEFGKRIRAADKDGDGRLSVSEFRAVVWSEIEGWKRAKLLRGLLAAAIVFTVLVVAANVAMAIAVATMSKEVRVGEAGVLTVRGGRGWVATSQAATSVDLADAFSLGINELRTVTQVILPADDGSVSAYQVERVTLNPRISATFFLSGAAALTVDEAGMALGTDSPAGRRLLQTRAAYGVLTSSNALRPMDGLYGNGY